MKKILSLTLALLMVVSAVPMAYAAENNWEGGTTVTYTGTGTEAFTVTVPAELAPGEEGTVTLAGTWAQNRYVEVTADEEVTLTSDIGGHQSILSIDFDAEPCPGSNFSEIENEYHISIAEIEDGDILFGTYSGHFNYYVEIMPIIDFEIVDTDHNTMTEFIQAPEGMTWAEYADSWWNDFSVQVDEDGRLYFFDNQDAQLFVTADDEFVNATDVIIPGYTYIAQ